MYWRILSHLTACLAADHIVLLDIRQDRYFLVPGALTSRVADWLCSTKPAAPPPAFIALMRDSGILREGEACAPAPRVEPVTIPVTLESSSAPASIGPIDRLGIAKAVVVSRIALRHLPLATVLRRYRERPVARRRVGLDATALAHRFASARQFSPLARQCLRDSLALGTWLKDQGVAPMLVFGVAAPAFTAHCWVQDGAAILNDSFDRVSRFTPILAL
jgi:hypothetical protein